MFYMSVCVWLYLSVFVCLTPRRWNDDKTIARSREMCHADAANGVASRRLRCR